VPFTTTNPDGYDGAGAIFGLAVQTRPKTRTSSVALVAFMVLLDSLFGSLLRAVCVTPGRSVTQRVSPPNTPAVKVVGVLDGQTLTLTQLPESNQGPGTEPKQASQQPPATPRARTCKWMIRSRLTCSICNSAASLCCRLGWDPTAWMWSSWSHTNLGGDPLQPVWPRKYQRLPSAGLSTKFGQTHESACCRKTPFLSASSIPLPRSCRDNVGVVRGGLANDAHATLGSKFHEPNPPNIANSPRPRYDAIVRS